MVLLSNFPPLVLSQAMSHGSGCTSLHPITPLLGARALGSTCSDIALLSCVYMRVVASATKATASAAVAANSGAEAVALVQRLSPWCRAVTAAATAVTEGAAAVVAGATAVAVGAVFAKNSHQQQNFLRFLLSLICGFGLGDNLLVVGF